MPYLPLCTTGICKHNTKSETWTFWTQGLRYTKPTSNVSAATKANCRVTSFKRKTSTFWTADIQTIVMIKQHLSTISHYFQPDKKLDILNELAFLLRFSSQLATQNALQHLPHSLFTKANMQGSILLIMSNLTCFDMQSGNQTSDPLITGISTLPPELRLPQITLRRVRGRKGETALKWVKS